MNQWQIENSEYSKDSFITNGNRFFCGNGFMGFRGVVDEAKKESMPALIVNGVYDRNGDKWREPVNFPNPLSVEVFHENQRLQLDSASETLSVINHKQFLDYRYGIYSRDTVWNSKGTEFHVVTRRFVSMSNKRLLCLEYSISSNKPSVIKINSLIDADVYDCNGPHFAQNIVQVKSDFMSFTGTVNETKLEFAEYVKTVGIEPCQTIELEKDKPVIFYIFAGISIEKECLNKAKETVFTAVNSGFEAELTAHKAVWDSIWESGDIRITGDEDAQTALRYSLYHLQSIAPESGSGYSIPARGLSGQTYKGAIFWDTEIFISPYFLYTNPEVVKSFIQYRIKTLSGAKAKALSYGYEGAFYAWESQEDGTDACSDYNVTDVFTGRPQRTYFKDAQIHISSAIVYMISKYLEVTNDYLILNDGAFEVILECAIFYASRCVYLPVKDTYELHDVIGPDEYHERVNNNAYTNQMALFTMNTAIHFASSVGKTDSSLSEVLKRVNFEKYLPVMKDICKKLKPFTYGKQDSNLGVIEQFDGYFKKEDCSLQDVRSRIINPKEYWGGANGVAAQTQIIKQADVAVLLNLFSEHYSEKEKMVNYKYYEKRTEHGSSLSACMYALLACQINRSDLAYDLFLKTAQVDLSGQSKQFAGTIYIGGTHPASSGGAWLTVVQGFCGLTIKNGKPELTPHLPSKWESVEFTILVHSKKYLIKVTKDSYKICEQ